MTKFLAVALVAVCALTASLYATAAPTTPAPTNGQLSAQIKSLKAKVYNLTWRMRATEVTAKTALCYGRFSARYIVQIGAAFADGTRPPGLRLKDGTVDDIC